MVGPRAREAEPSGGGYGAGEEFGGYVLGKDVGSLGGGEHGLGEGAAGVVFFGGHYDVHGFPVAYASLEDCAVDFGSLFLMMLL